MCLDVIPVDYQILKEFAADLMHLLEVRIANVDGGFQQAFQHAARHILVIFAQDFHDSDCVFENWDVVDFQNPQPVSDNAIISYQCGRFIVMC